MKANLYAQGSLLSRSRALQLGFGLAEVSAVILLLGGCATYQTGTVSSGDPEPLAEPCRLQLGTIALVCPATPAEVSFDQAEGQIETFGERASLAAGAVLDPSGVTADPGSQAVVGVGGFVAAPFAAMAAGWSARERLRADQLSECEANLLQQLKNMAVQQHLQNSLLKAADAKSQCRFLVVEPAQTAASHSPAADSVLQTQVQELRLERTGKGDNSYALRMKATARLVRTVDGAVLYERPVEYRSGTCLFLDWTLDNSLQKVAATGYREMAERLVDRLFVATPQGPLLAGAGYKKSPGRPEAALLARISPAAGAKPASSRMSARAGAPVHSPVVQAANFPVANTGTIGIYSPEVDSRLTLRKPLTRDDAAVQAVRDMEWNFDGLYNHPNLMVSLPSIAVAVPLGVWKQGVAVVRGLTDRKFREAEAALTTAARQTHPQDDLALQVAQHLAPLTSQRVMLAGQALPSTREQEANLARTAANTTSPGQPLSSAGGGQGLDTALEIRVLSAGLCARDGVNPPMALCVEAQARLSRIRDGQELYSFPVHYRSQEHKFTAWAAKDARLFRQEFQRCYRDLSSLISNQLVARRLVEPDRLAYPTLAGK